MSPIPNEQLPRGDRDEAPALAASMSLCNSIEELLIALKAQNRRVPLDAKIPELVEAVRRSLRENLQGRMALTAVQVHALIDAQARKLRELEAGADRAAERIRELTAAHEAAEKRATCAEDRVKRAEEWFRKSRSLELRPGGAAEAVTA